MGFELYLITGVTDMAEAEKSGLKLAQSIYRTGRTGRLYRASGAPEVNRGMAAVYAESATAAAVSSAAAELCAECADRGFDGALIHGEGAGAMCAELTRRGLRVYCPEGAAERGSAEPVVNTAMSGGSLEDRLREAVRAYGAAAAELTLTRMDFTLPERTGSGRTLTAEELKALSARAYGRSFYSNDLAAYYFRYRDGNRTHFVLYDNSDSFRRKLALLNRIGIEAAFVRFSETRGILDKINKPLP